MKKVMILIALFSILILDEAGLSYQPEEKWEDISYGVDETDLKMVAVNLQNPDIIYAGSAKSIFKTSDGGKNWRKVYMIRGTLTSVNVISIDPKNTEVVYAGTQNGLYKSANGGTNWNRIFEGLGPQEKDIRHMAIDALDTNRLYIGSSSGIFTTQDAGTIWNKSSNETSNQVINFITQDFIDPDIIYVAANSGVFKSSDHGLSFEKIFTAAAQTEETETEEISQDANSDETATHSGKMPNCVAIDSRDANKIYIGTDSGVFVSDDAGETWGKLTSSGLINNKITSLVSLRNGSLCAATKNGIFKISKPYQKWGEFHAGLASKHAQYLAYHQKNNFMLAATKKGLYRRDLDSDADAGIQNYSMQDPEIQKLLARFESEPSIQQIQEVAIRYAEVHKKKIDDWRNGAKRKALLPKVSIGIDESEGDYYYSGTWRGREGSTGWDLSLTWDLGEFIWNSDQTSIDTRSRLMVQLRDDILNEVTQLYFERRRLQIELLTNPPKTIEHRFNKELRLQELTAGIDALTGGWFSKRIIEGN